MRKMEITYLYKKRDILFHRRWCWDKGSYPAKWLGTKFMVYYRNMGFIEIKNTVLIKEEKYGESPVVSLMRIIKFKNWLLKHWR